MPYYPPASSGSGGTVDSVVAGTNIDVDATDAANPIVSVETLTLADVSDITATATEVNYTDGVTSAIQTQLDAKAASADLTTHMSDTTTHGTTGDIVGTSDTQTLSNKTINNTNSVTVKDELLILQNSGDTTKQAYFSTSAMSTGTVAAHELPAVSSTLATTSTSQTLTNKTLTSPVITTPTGLVKGDVGLGNVDNTSDATKNAAASTLTNKNISGSSNTITNIGPGARTGGFFIGTISGATLGSTGNKAITGVGFTPKLVRFATLPSSSTGATNQGLGAMTSSAQWFSANATDSAAARGRASGTDGCIAWVPAGSSTPSLKASYVSMDSDGFTINVTTASSGFSVAYECYG